MNNNDNLNYNFNDDPTYQKTKNLEKDRLEFLRKNTILNPIQKFKVINARNTAEKYQKLYNEHNQDKINVDYTIADELEYQFRLEIWQNKLEKNWRNNPDGTSLMEYADFALLNNMEREKQQNLQTEQTKLENKQNTPYEQSKVENNKNNYLNSKIYYKTNNSVYELNPSCKIWIFKQIEENQNIKLNTNDNNNYFIDNNEINLETKFDLLINIINTTFMDAQIFVDDYNFESSFIGIGPQIDMIKMRAKDLKNQNNIEQAIELLENYADKILKLYQNDLMKAEQENLNNLDEQAKRSSK